MSNLLTTPHDGPTKDTPLEHRERIPMARCVRGDYEMRFALTYGDRERALRLRHNVFQEELGEGIVSLDGMDRDHFDDQCEHLLVLHHPTETVVGTYRMQIAASAKAGAGFYTHLEFDLDRLGTAFLEQGVELGRACVSERHRNKFVLYMLWLGLTAYLEHHHKVGFFGCSSLTSQDMAEGLLLYEQLRAEGYLHETLRTVAQDGWRCTAATLDGPAVKVPRLFRAYLRQGAKILSEPAIDREFGTIDYLTYVEMTPELRQRYALPPGSQPQG